MKITGKFQYTDCCGKLRSQWHTNAQGKIVCNGGCVASVVNSNIPLGEDQTIGTR